MAEVESKLEPKSEEIESKPEINATKEESKSEDAKDDSFSEAKDKVIFLTEDEASVPSKVGYSHIFPQLMGSERKIFREIKTKNTFARFQDRVQLSMN